MWQISSFSILLAGELPLDSQVLWHTWSQAFQGKLLFFFSNLVFSGVIKLPILGGIKHCTSMVILRDFSFNSAFLGLVILWI